jgi:hypothetical protein
LSIQEDGAFVEFDAPPELIKISGVSSRNVGLIPTALDQPLRLDGLHAVFIKVRCHWWEFWRTKAE